MGLYINGYDDFPEKHDFSREEIKDGVLLVARRMGSLPLAMALLDEKENVE